MWLIPNKFLQILHVFILWQETGPHNHAQEEGWHSEAGGAKDVEIATVLVVQGFVFLIHFHHLSEASPICKAVSVL